MKTFSPGTLQTPEREGGQRGLKMVWVNTYSVRVKRTWPDPLVAILL